MNSTEFAEAIAAEYAEHEASQRVYGAFCTYLDNGMTPQELAIFRVRRDTGMDYLQAYRHLECRRILNGGR